MLRAALAEPAVPCEFSENLLKPYYLDRASILAARALGNTGNRRVLDLCAAPGGKTLVLASTLGGEGGIVANERSADRRRRLRQVLDDHLPPGLREKVVVTGHDASRWGLYEQNLYDLVLLDAPCSSERHLVRNPGHLRDWSPARTRRLAQQALAMLLAALAAAKPGGRILYSTCALSPGENDGVIERAMRKRPGLFSSLPAEEAGTEPTIYGRNVWPDRAEGTGPIYFALLEKKQDTCLA